MMISLETFLYSVSIYNSTGIFVFLLCYPGVFLVVAHIDQLKTERKGPGKFSAEEISEANFRLKYGIKMLQQNDGVKQPFKSAISAAFNLQRDLERDGFWWQAKKLNMWILRTLKKRDFL